MKIRNAWVALALVVLGAGAASADIQVKVATDGSERLVIVRADDRRTQMSEVALMRDGDDVVPLIDVAKCADFGSRHIARARTEPFTGITLMGQYNAVNLWLGRVCHGKSDVLPEPSEARAWLDEIAGVTLGDKPLVDAHEMMAEFLIFGAPGFEPDPEAAVRYLTKEAETRPGRAGLFLAYLYENGIGVEADAAQALKWIEVSAAAGDFEGQMLRAQSLELGIERPKDEVAAVKAYDEIKAHAPVAKFRRGLMYLDGRGTAQDACKAKDLLSQAFSNVWSSAPQAKKYLDRIAAERLCP